MSDVGLPLFAVRAQVASAIHAVVQTSRTHDGRREITHVARVASGEHGYALHTLYSGVRR